MEFPDTRTKKVAAGCLMRCSLRSIEFWVKSSAGEGNPAETEDAATGRYVGMLVAGGRFVVGSVVLGSGFVRVT